MSNPERPARSSATGRFVKKKAKIRASGGGGTFDLGKTPPHGRANRELMGKIERLETELFLLRHRSRRRPASVRLYIASDSSFAAFKVFAAVQGVLNALGFDPPVIRDVSDGSVFTRMGASIKRTVSSREAKVLAEQARLTAEAMTVEKANAENVATVVNAMATLAESAKDAGSVVLDIGSFTYVQTQDPDGKTHIRAWTRTARQVAEAAIPDEAIRTPEALEKLMDGTAEPPELSR